MNIQSALVIREFTTMQSNTTKIIFSIRLVSLDKLVG